MGDARRYVRETLDRKEPRLMGFGHRVYRAYDPRAAVLRDTCKRLGAPRYEVALELEKAAIAELAERHPERRMETNVDFWAAVLLDFADVPGDMMTPLFAAPAPPAGPRTSSSKAHRAPHPAQRALRRSRPATHRGRRRVRPGALTGAAVGPPPPSPVRTPVPRDGIRRPASGQGRGGWMPVTVADGVGPRASSAPCGRTTATTTHPPDTETLVSDPAQITIPADLLPADGRFGSVVEGPPGAGRGPRRDRPHGARHVPPQAPVKNLVKAVRSGLSTYFDLPEATRSCWATVARRRSGTSRPSAWSATGRST